MSNDTSAVNRRARMLLDTLGRAALKTLCRRPKALAALALLQEDGYHVLGVRVTLSLAKPEIAGAPRTASEMSALVNVPGIGIVNKAPVRVLPEKVPDPETSARYSAIPVMVAPMVARPPRARPRKPRRP